MNHQPFTDLCDNAIRYLKENRNGLFLGAPKKALPLPTITQEKITLKKPKKSAPPIVPKEEPKKELRPPAETNKSPFTLKPVIKKNVDSHGDLLELIDKACSSLTIMSKMPSDLEAQKERFRWKDSVILPQFPILYEQEQEQHLSFLTNICQAITQRQFTSRPIEVSSWEKQHRWEEALSKGNVRAIIAPDILIYTHKTLSKMIKKERHALFIGSIPLITLTSIQSYKESPPLKKSLWTAIVQQMQKKH